MLIQILKNFGEQGHVTNGSRTFNFKLNVRDLNFAILIILWTISIEILTLIWLLEKYLIYLLCKVRIKQFKDKCSHYNKYSIAITFAALVFRFDRPLFYNAFQRERR